MNHCLDGVFQGPFTWEKIPDKRTQSGIHYRIRDRADNRLATCYDELNANFIVDMLNRAGSVPVKMPEEFKEGVVLLQEPFVPNVKLIRESLARSDARDRKGKKSRRAKRTV